MSQILTKPKIRADKATQEQQRQRNFHSSFWGWLRQYWLSIPLEEATFARRGFCTRDAQTQQRLEQIGCTFLSGYHAAIANAHPEALMPQLNGIENEWRGFAFEGAAMGLYLLDYFTPWQQNRVRGFLLGAASAHIYMVYVGIGWALARLPFALKRYLRELNQHPSTSKTIDPLLGWLAVDGYGFHQGYFHWRKYVDGIAIPQELSGYSSRVFDQGLGRSLWFVRGANIAHIARTIQNFHPDRRGDLWSGVGLACAYAGGVAPDEIKALPKLASGYLSQVAQGAAFAAKARLRAGNLTQNTEIACEILCGMSAHTAASITDLALVGLSGDGTIPAYEVWRQQIRAHF